MGRKRVADVIGGRKSALYIRVSTHWQVDKDSLPLQREDLINYSKYVLSIEAYEIFEDAGYSAKNTDRPAYQQMIARLRTGEFSHLVVWKIDRISRNLIDFATMYQEVKSLGIVFVSKNEQFDTSSAMGEAMLKIILVFAELERNMTSERVSAVMISRAGNGQWNGGRVPLGYSYDKESDTFSVVEQEAFIVKMIYDAYERERSLVAVSKELNAKGIKSRRGKSWSPTTIQIILRNPFYKGTYRYNYRDVAKSGKAGPDFKAETEWVMIEDHHPPIISAEQWEKVGEQLTANTRIAGSGLSYNRGNVHVFAGLLRCGYCGFVMAASPDRERANGWRPSMYLCSRKRRFDDCPNKYVSDRTLGPFVLNYISNMMKAQRSFGRSTSIETLEKKLLRGSAMSEVAHIGRPGLQELYDTLRRQKIPNVSYEPAGIVDSQEANPSAQEMDILVSEKRRAERALARLQSLFLYSEDSIAEKDFIVEKKRISDEIAAIDSRIETIERDRASHFTISDEDFMEKASYFILSQKLTDKREVDYARYIRKIDPGIVKDFLHCAVQNFCIKNGRVASIRFKNGIEHTFLYHDNG